MLVARSTELRHVAPRGVGSRAGDRLARGRSARPEAPDPRSALPPLEVRIDDTTDAVAACAERLDDHAGAGARTHAVFGGRVVEARGGRTERRGCAARVVR